MNCPFCKEKISVWVKADPCPHCQQPLRLSFNFAILVPMGLVLMIATAVAATVLHLNGIPKALLMGVMIGTTLLASMILVPKQSEKRSNPSKPHSEIVTPTPGRTADLKKRPVPDPKPRTRKSRQ